MATKFRLSSLIPAGLIVERSDESNGVIIVSARGAADRRACPLCNRMSDRVHSRYVRIIADLPCAGTQVQLRLSARRFVCEMTFCRRRIFVERFGELVVPERSRRTARLDTVVHHLGLALGGRPAAAFAKRLMIPVSNDTLIRAVRKKSAAPNDALSVVGVDDWAFRRNHRYGTVVCDLERRRIIKLLPDREIETVSTFLAQHPEIAIVSRDRGGGYREAAARALPHAVQVADRWHLMENASAAFLDVVRKSMRAIRAAIGATTIDPKLLTCADPASTFADQIKRGVTDGIIGEPQQQTTFQPTPVETKQVDEKASNPFTPTPEQRQEQRRGHELEPEEVWRARLEREQQEQYLRERQRQRMARMQANDAAYDAPLAIDRGKLEARAATDDASAARPAASSTATRGASDLYAAALRAGLGGQNIDPNEQKSGIM